MLSVLPGFTAYKPRSSNFLRMVDLIPFPLHARAALVRSIADDLQIVHGPAANTFWRERIAGIVADMRAAGLTDAAIRSEILGLQDAVQIEMRQRTRRQA
jgi:hypothetical protein